MVDYSLLLQIIARIEQILADLQRLQRANDVIALILAGDLLTLRQAAQIAGCSDETIRRACEKAAEMNEWLGVNIETRWLVGKMRLLERIERNKGKPERLKAETRAKKYASWGAAAEAARERDDTCGLSLRDQARTRSVSSSRAPRAHCQVRSAQ
jgi:hypothetical protein